MDPYFASFLSQPFTVIDVETTSLAGDMRICEIGAVRVHDGLIQDTFETLVDPCVSLTNTGVHGITNAMLDGAPRFESALPHLLDFAQGSIFVGHNATFDIRALVTEQRRMGLQPAIDQPYVCTVRLGRVAFPGLDSYRLARLTAALEVTNRRPHAGLTDACATAEAFIDLVARLNKKGGLTESQMRRRVIGQRPIFTDSLPVLFDRADMKPRPGSMSLDDGM